MFSVGGTAATIRVGVQGLGGRDSRHARLKQPTGPRGRGGGSGTGCPPCTAGSVRALTGWHGPVKEVLACDVENPL